MNGTGRRWVIFSGVVFGVVGTVVAVSSMSWLPTPPRGRSWTRLAASLVINLLKVYGLKVFGLKLFGGESSTA